MSVFNKVLVCDDEDEIAHLVGRVLGDAGYLCLRARDGQQALFLAAAEAPDLLILDRMMPRVDGVIVCQWLKADPVLSRIPVLMLTALGEVTERVRGLDAGADDYLAKPFDLRELMARVRALIRASRRERDRSAVTLLPGPAALDAAVESRLEARQPFSLLHVDIVGFDAFVALEGVREGEALIAEAGRLLAQALRSARANDGAIITHHGGDDFFVVGPAGEGADALATALGEAVADVLSARSKLRLELAVTTIAAGSARTVDELSRALAAARRRAAS